MSINLLSVPNNFTIYANENNAGNIPISQEVSQQCLIQGQVNGDTITSLVVHGANVPPVGGQFFIPVKFALITALDGSYKIASMKIPAFVITFPNNNETGIRISDIPDQYDPPAGTTIDAPIVFIANAVRIVGYSILGAGDILIKKLDNSAVGAPAVTFSSDTCITYDPS